MTAANEPILLYQDRGQGIIHLTMNRPKAFNSLSSELMSEMQSALDGAHEDPSIRLIIIDGSGPGFSSGHDLREVTSFQTVKERQDLMEQCSKLMLSVVHCSKPVIAKVHGVAAAAGCQLVASCDLAVATDDAKFLTPGVNIGLFCSTPMVALSRNITRKHAMEMLLTGAAMDAPTAHRFGLINRHVPNAELDNTEMHFAKLIVTKSAYTVRIGKEAFYQQMDMKMNDAYKMASEVMVENMLAADAQEGMTAFIEKREPVWSDN